MTQRHAVPDAGFSAAQLDAAEQIVRIELGGPDRVELAFLGGSLAVGLGHATSDVDLYVVGDDLPDYAETFDRNGVSVHVVTLTAEFVHRLVRLCGAYATTGFDRDQTHVDLRTLHGLVRITTGVRVLCGPQWSAELRSLRRDVLRQILIARNAQIFAAHAEDVLGALISGDPYTAAGASGIALEAAAEAVLAAADDLYVGPKFLFRRLGRNPVTADWSPLLWRLLNGAFGDVSEVGPDNVVEAHVRAVVEQRLLIGNLLLSECALTGWDHPLDRLTNPPSNPTDTSRSPYFVPIRFADGWALVGPDNGYEVTEEVVRLWREFTPKSDGASAAAVRALTVIGALGREFVPTVANPDLLIGSGVQLAGRFACHPKTRPAGQAVGA
jgi:hypothetical protein